MNDPRDNVQQEFLAEAQELVEALSGDLLLLDEAHHRSTTGGWRFHGLPWEQC